MGRTSKFMTDHSEGDKGKEAIMDFQVSWVLRMAADGKLYKTKFYTIHVLTRSHDRFLLLDNDVYHVGASIKDLGKRWFAIMKMQETKADEIIEHL